MITNIREVKNIPKKKWLDNFHDEKLTMYKVHSHTPL